MKKLKNYCRHGLLTMQNMKNKIPIILRILIFISLLLLLFQPFKITIKTKQSKPIISILMDNSLSMNILDPQKRINVLKRILTDISKKLEKDFELIYFAFGKNLNLINKKNIEKLQPIENQTQIIQNIIKSSKLKKINSIILLSDGIDTTDTSIEYLHNFGIPVNSILIGSYEKSRDVAIVDIRAPDFSLKNSHIKISATIFSNGFQKNSIELNLFQIKNNEKYLIQQKKIDISTSKQTIDVDFDFFNETVGFIKYRLELPQYKNEVTYQNNSKEFIIESIPDRIRILYLCGQPSTEYALLRYFLKSHPGIELVSFVILRNPEDVALVPDEELALIPFPSQEIFFQEIFNFDLLIFENFSYRRFGITPSMLENIVKFVKNNGGGFLMIGGENSFSSGGYKYTPIESVMPVYLNDSEKILPDKFPLRVKNYNHPILSFTEEYKNIFQKLPHLEGINTLGKNKDFGVTLMSNPWAKNDAGEDLPVCVVGEIGKGRVMIFATDTSWRWSMAGAYIPESIEFYQRFWINSVKWLTKSEEMKKLRIILEKNKFDVNEKIKIKILALDNDYKPSENIKVILKIVSTKGEMKHLNILKSDESGIFLSEYTPEFPGSIRFYAESFISNKKIALDEKNVNVEFSQKAELENLIPDRDFMKSIADITGGRFFYPETFSIKDIKFIPVEKEIVSYQKKPFFHFKKIFWFLFIIYIFELYIRKRIGLP